MWAASQERFFKKTNQCLGKYWHRHRQRQLQPAHASMHGNVNNQFFWDILHCQLLTETLRICLAAHHASCVISQKSATNCLVWPHALIMTDFAREQARSVANRMVVFKVALASDTSHLIWHASLSMTWATTIIVLSCIICKAVIVDVTIWKSVRYDMCCM